jgi:hypothetical protein
MAWERAPERMGECPPRFLAAEKGNAVKGMARYQETKKWRAANDIDGILNRPHKKFEDIKKNYPHYFHKHARNGYPVYYEQPGGVNLEGLRTAGVTIEDLLWHYSWITEYLWVKIEPRDNAKVLTILDVTGIGLRDARGLVMDFIRQASKTISTHYPERSYMIFIINVPSWFNMVWNVIKPFLDPVTLQKIRIHKTNYQQDLLKEIEPANLPVLYGGQCTELAKSKEEIAMASLVKDVLQGKLIAYEEDANAK